MEGRFSGSGILKTRYLRDWGATITHDKGIYMFGGDHYVPMLKAKAGEITALGTIPPEYVSMITPLLEVPPLLEKDGVRPSIGDHVGKMVEYLTEHWSHGRRCFVDADAVDAERLSNGKHPLAALANAANEESVRVVPVVGLRRSAAYLYAAQDLISQWEDGCCLRLSDEDFGSTDLDVAIPDFLSGLSIGSRQVDLIVDLGGVTEAETGRVLLALRGMLSSLPYLHEWRSLTVSAAGFPETVGRIPKGGHKRIPRADWKLYHQLRSAPWITRVPAYGDYGISPLGHLEFDPKTMAVGVKLKYTSKDHFLVMSHGTLKETKGETFRDICEWLIAQPEYSGSTFSWGDNYIAECARGRASTANPERWVKIGTSHHLMFVLRQLGLVTPNASQGDS